MPSDCDALYNAALELPEDQRMALVVRLMDTISDQAATLSLDDAQLMSEIERRFADQGPVVPWSKVRTEN